MLVFLSCSVFDLSGPPYKSCTLASYLPYGRVIFSSNPARKWKRCQTIPEFQTISSRQLSKKDCSSRHSFDFILGRQSWILFYDFMILQNVFSYCVKRHFQVSLFFPPNWMVESHASEYIGVFLFCFLDLLPAWFYTVDLLLN